MLFRGFSKEQLKRFELFLMSPYFNQSEKLVKFYRLIEPHQPLFDSKKLDKEKLYAGLHAKTEYNDATMRELISELFKLAKAFIAHNKLSENSLDASVLRYDWFFNNNMTKLAHAEVDARESLLKEQTLRDWYYYYHRRFFDLHKFQTTAAQFRSAEHKLLDDLNLFAPIHSLNRDYLISCLSLQIYLLNLARIYKFSLDETLVRQVRFMASNYINKGDTLIDILFNIFQMLRTNNEKYFFELKNRFFQNDKSVPVTVAMEAGVALENFCLKKIREGADHFSAELMPVYRFEVENELFMESHEMNYVYYLNVAVRGAEENDITWTEHFVENYHKFLPQEIRIDAQNFARAHLLFARKKYEEALRLALSCKVPFFISKILLRNLVARIQYELGMWDELQVGFAAYTHHLNDERFTDERKQFFQKFIKAMRQLCELNASYNGEKLMQLSNLVDTQKGFANKKWFKEKIKALADSHSRRNNAG
jgi:hypothetical protein